MHADTIEIVRTLLETSDTYWSTLDKSSKLRLLRTAQQIKNDRREWARDQARLLKIYKKHKLL